MSEPIMPDQETATLALMMDREVDKRVMLALSRALNPSNNWEVREIETAYSTNNPAEIQRIVQSMLINALMSDGSLMHQIRSKLAEQLNKPY
jgi:hypothetical protein